MVEPTVDHLLRAESVGHDLLRQRLAALLEAAAIAEIPTFILVHDDGTQERLCISPASTAVVIAWGDALFPWGHGELVASLQHLHRPNIVLSGFWVEDTISATALHAIDDGFDVYVAADAVAARRPGFSHCVLDRLIQCWAMPILAQQLLHEWMIASSDRQRRAALAQLYQAEIARS